MKRPALFKKTVCGLAAALLLLCLAVTGFASEAGAQSSAPPPAQAATWEELLAWLQPSSGQAAGEVRLTADITVPAGAYAELALPGSLTLDCGPYALTAQGTLILSALDLTIRGQGGADGMLRAAPGGTLSLNNYGRLEVAAQEGYALYQQEGGVLEVNCCTVTGAAAFAAEPVITAFTGADTDAAWQRGFKAWCALVEPGRTLQSAQLPATALADVNFMGATTRQEVALQWDLAAPAQELAARRRTVLTATAPGYRSIAPAPRCLVAFRDAELVFLNAQATLSQYAASFKLLVAPPAGACTAALEYSLDGGSWLVYAQHGFAPGPAAQIAFDLARGDWDGTEKSFVNWGAQEPPVRLRLRWQTPQGPGYSDVLYFDKAGYAAGDEIGGNRGGGTDPIPSDPPESLPASGSESLPDSESLPQTPDEESLPPEVPDSGATAPSAPESTGPASSAPQEETPGPGPDSASLPSSGEILPGEPPAAPLPPAGVTAPPAAGAAPAAQAPASAAKRPGGAAPGKAAEEAKEQEEEPEKGASDAERPASAPPASAQAQSAVPAQAGPAAPQPPSFALPLAVGCGAVLALVCGAWWYLRRREKRG